MLDQLYTVETPEQIDLVYDVAGIGSRIIAALIDHVLMSLILSLGYVVVVLLIENLLDFIDTALAAGILGILIFLFMCAYYIFFETIWNGQTPGKRLVGIRMVRVGGRPLGFLGSTIRNFIRLADFLPLLYGIGVLAMFIDRQSRRLGDMAAGALAVRERKAITLDMLVTAAAKDAPVVAMADEQRIPNLHALRAQDFAMVETYLRRRAQIAPEIRTRLDTTLVEGLEARLGYPVQRTLHNVEQFLFRVAAEHQLLERTATIAEANGSLVAEPPAPVADGSQPTEEMTMVDAAVSPTNDAAPVVMPPGEVPADELRDTVPRDER